jgi:6-pyruvoyl-tetrahydropterin synthase
MRSAQAGRVGRVIDFSVIKTLLCDWLEDNWDHRFLLWEQDPMLPAKITDSRFADYQRTYGDESWELDALSPAYLTALINDAVEPERDEDLWNERLQEISDIKSRISKVAEEF